MRSSIVYYMYVGWRARKKNNTITNSGLSTSNNSNGNGRTYIDEFDAFEEIVFNLVIKKKRNETKLAWRYSVHWYYIALNEEIKVKKRVENRKVRDEEHEGERMKKRQ